MAADKAIRVLCVDDHRLVREGIASLINRHDDMEVVGMAASAEEAVRAYRRLRPDVTLMDLQLAGSSGLDAIRDIRHDDPAARVVVVTMYQGEEDVYSALEAGAITYLLKDVLPDDLIDVIRQVDGGQQPIFDFVRLRLSERATRVALTSRELQIVQRVAQGMRNKEIAADLGIGEETVRVHLKRIFSKLKVHDRTAVLSAAVKRGLVHL